MYRWRFNRNGYGVCARPYYYGEGYTVINRSRSSIHEIETSEAIVEVDGEHPLIVGTEWDNMGVYKDEVF